MVDIILDLLRSDGSIILNKKMIKVLGLEATALYSELLSRYKYFSDRGQLTDDGFFYNTVEDIEEVTALSDYQQRKIISKLVKLGLLETKVMGIPAKRYFKIIQNEHKLYEMLSLNSSSQKTSELSSQKTSELSSQKTSELSSQKTSELVVKKLEGNNTNINNTNINNTNNKGKNFPTPKQESLVKPESPKSKKVKDILVMKDMTRAFTSNSKIFSLLEEYFNLRVKKGLQINQWKIILEDLRKYAGEDSNLAEEEIRSAIAGGYMQIIASWKKGKQNQYNKPSFDNLANNRRRQLTKEEDEPALDENGKEIEF